MGSSLKGDPARGQMHRSSSEYRMPGDLPGYRTVITPASDRQASVITVSHHSASLHSADDRDTGWQHDEDVALMQPEDRSGAHSWTRRRLLFVCRIHLQFM